MFNKRLAGSLLLSALIYSAPTMAQSALAQQSGAQQSSKTSTAKSATAKPASAKSAAAAKKSAPKPLVYVEDNRKAADSSTTTAAGTSAKKPSAASASQKTLSSDITKAFQQNCPDVGLTESKARAAYEVTFEREPGAKGVKGAFGLTNAVHKTSKIEVMNKSGKELFSETGHSTGQLVKDACTAIGTPGTKVAQK
jgi:hypothetical protein